MPDAPWLRLASFGSRLEKSPDILQHHEHNTHRILTVSAWADCRTRADQNQGSLYVTLLAVNPFLPGVLLRATTRQRVVPSYTRP